MKTREQIFTELKSVYRRLGETVNELTSLQNIDLSFLQEGDVPADRLAAFVLKWDARKRELDDLLPVLGAERDTLQEELKQVKIAERASLIAASQVPSKDEGIEDVEIEDNNDLVAVTYTWTNSDGAKREATFAAFWDNNPFDDSYLVVDTDAMTSTQYVAWNLLEDELRSYYGIDEARAERQQMGITD